MSKKDLFEQLKKKKRQSFAVLDSIVILTAHLNVGLPHTICMKGIHDNMQLCKCVTYILVFTPFVALARHEVS